MARLNSEQTDRVNHLIAKALGVDPAKVTDAGFTAEFTHGNELIKISWQGIGYIHKEQFSMILNDIAREAGEMNTV